MKLTRPYATRTIRFLELWRVNRWRLKVYGIVCRGSAPPSGLIHAAKAVARTHLRNRPTRHETYGVGFLGIHDGRAENQVFLDLWINENELLHFVYVSPKKEPADLKPAPPDHNSVCVWDLCLQAFEREAWIDCVLADYPTPDLKSYLARRFNADV